MGILTGRQSPSTDSGRVFVTTELLGSGLAAVFGKATSRCPVATFSETVSRGTRKFSGILRHSASRTGHARNSKAIPITRVLRPRLAGAILVMPDAVQAQHYAWKEAHGNITIKNSPATGTTRRDGSDAPTCRCSATAKWSMTLPGRPRSARIPATRRSSWKPRNFTLPSLRPRSRIRTTTKHRAHVESTAQ